MGYTSLAKIAQSKGLERFKRLQERVKRVRYETGIILYAEILFLFKLARIAFFFFFVELEGFFFAVQVVYITLLNDYSNLEFQMKHNKLKWISKICLKKF